MTTEQSPCPFCARDVLVWPSFGRDGGWLAACVGCAVCLGPIRSREDLLASWAAIRGAMAGKEGDAWSTASR